MIPRVFIREWRTQVPWIEDFQVEQDLVISRAIAELFSDSVFASALALRGGTALNKLLLRSPSRYSEDIDLVQIEAGPAGPLMDRVRSVLDPWLGQAVWKQSKGRVTFGYRFLSEETPTKRMRLKVEINTREHFAVLGFEKFPYHVDSGWFSGTADVTTFVIDELLATKLRALYQRRKSRDLFDLIVGLSGDQCDAERIVATFTEYMSHEGGSVTRAMFERNLAEKLRDPVFLEDMNGLVGPTTEWRPNDAARIISQDLIALLPGEPWKGNLKT